ncbi:PAS domain-containing protein [Dongia sedimenti]|uniref:histidine kinase n=1 Tax=Dongia sedimenti TaxID=3064282 RepID=A0ABU0YRW4_9PROT|nr:PAS domain-containing protein [Rhodospirillaceae bacterium R-7]
MAEKSPVEVEQVMRILESMPGHAWAADAGGRFTYVSANTLAYIGELAADLGPIPDSDEFGWRRVVHPDDYERVVARWRHCLESGDHYDTEHRIRRWDGVYKWFRNSGLASRDPSGRIVGWYGTTIEIDDQKKAEAALRDRERELSQLVDLVPSHLWRLTPAGEPVFFNKRMVDFLGLDIGDVHRPGKLSLATLIETIVHPDEVGQVKDALDRSLSTGDSFAIRYRLRRADGAYRWMSSRAEAMRDQGGRILQWYGLCHDIHDQVRGEEALQRSERRLQQMIDAVPSMIWTAAADGKPTYVNRRLTDVTSATLEDITADDGSLYLSVVHPDDRDAAKQAVARSFETGAPYLMRYRQLRRGGTYRWTETRAEPLRGESGAIVQWYGVSVDIEDLVNAQTALRDRERELSQLVDLVPSYLWRLTPEGEPNFFNKRFIDFLGLDIGDADRPNTSRSSAMIESVVHPDDAAGLDQALNRCFATGERFFMRYRLRRADGVYRWMEGRAEPLRDDRHRILQWYGLSQDIDDQLRAEEALRESERSLRQLVETLPALIYCATPDGTPIYRSQKLSDYLGFGLEDKDEDGKSRLVNALDYIIHPDDLAEVKEKYAHSLSTGEPYARRHRLRRYDGEYRWVETRAGPMRNSEGEIVQWNGVCFEIEDQVRAQEDLRLAQERLARASQAASLAELSASIAHEVNQPLAAIVANSHACQRWLVASPPNIERAQKTVERVIRDANAAADIVTRVHALFKPSGDTRVQTPINGIVHEAYDLMAEEATRRRVRMTVELEGDLPPVALDSVQIQQVLTNLMRNGIEAMEATASNRILRLGVYRRGEFVHIEVSDLGPDTDISESIFEPFFTTKEHGMGMGLAICRSIVESHGGRLWVEKSHPHGAKFIFTLPIGETASA